MAELYAAFSGYAASPLRGCPCCVDDAHSAALVGVPLRDLRPVDLERYVRKSMTTWGDAAAFRRFLPRILEIMALDWGESLFAEEVAGKLVYGGVDNWPTTEREALTRFVHALRGPPPAAPLADLLPLAFAVGLDPDESLGPLLDAGALAPLAGLVADFNFGARRPLPSLRAGESAAVGRWLRRAALREAMERAFLEAHDGAEAGVLSAALEVLEPWSDPATPLSHK